MFTLMKLCASPFFTRGFFAAFFFVGASFPLSPFVAPAFQPAPLPLPLAARLLTVYKYRRLFNRCRKHITGTWCRFTLCLNTKVKKFITCAFFYFYIFNTGTWIYKLCNSLWLFRCLKGNSETKLKYNIRTVRIWNNVWRRISMSSAIPFNEFTAIYALMFAISVSL